MKSSSTLKNKPLVLFLVFCLLALPVTAFGAEPKQTTLDISHLAIPESLGKIDERFQGTSKRWVINIQDVHAHFGAQENIAAIINHLNEVYGLRLVAYEGGWNTTSYPQTWAIQSSRQKQLVLRTLLEEDIITGPAFAAMNSKTPITLHGIENPELYKQNLALYLQFIEGKVSVEKAVADFQTTLSGKKTELYNPELLSFDRSLLEFRENSKTAEKFLPLLSSLAKTLELDLSGLPQMQLFMRVSALEKSIDKKKLQSEIERITLEQKNDRLSFEEMLRHGILTDKKLSFYPNAQKQRDLLKLSDTIAHDQLFGEIDQAIVLVKEKLFKSAEEKKLDQAFGRFITAKKIMIFKATPSDLKLYREEEALIREEMTAARLIEHLDLGVAFYNLAERRDAVFFKNVSSSPELVSEDIALVAGGFHTKGMQELLRKAGISYMVITPQLGQESPNEKLYFKQLQSLKFLTQTLSEIGNRLSDHQDNLIAEALRQFASAQGRFRDIRQITAFVANAAKPEKKEASLSFLSLSEEDQRAAVLNAAESMLTGDSPVSVVVRADALKKILASSPLAAGLLKAVIDNPANHLSVLYRNYTDLPDIITDAFGNDNVKTIGDTDIRRAISHLPKSDKQNKLAVIADDYEDSKRLVLREDPIALLLFRPLLEGGWLYAWNDAETQSIITQFVSEILSAKGFLISA